MTRSVAITIAGRSGEETHVVTVNEMPAHAHGVGDPGHAHGYSGPVGSVQSGGGEYNAVALNFTGQATNGAGTGIWIGNTGGGGAHENVQPTVFVPYIVKLDD